MAPSAGAILRGAMSEQNLEAVRRFYEAWSRDDLPALTELMDPEIEYVNPSGAVEPGTRRGLAEFNRAVEKVFAGWDTWTIEPTKVRAAGDQVAAVVRYRYRIHGSVADLETHMSHLWTLRDGRVVEFAWFHDTKDALEAAGLSE